MGSITNLNLLAASRGNTWSASPSPPFEVPHQQGAGVSGSCSIHSPSHSHSPSPQRTAVANASRFQYATPVGSTHRKNSHHHEQHQHQHHDQHRHQNQNQNQHQPAQHGSLPQSQSAPTDAFQLEGQIPHSPMSTPPVQIQVVLSPRMRAAVGR